ncbi:MAG TPA: DUF4214 domain-containing protein [Pyrinomonadaceae bacterium]|jgi:hypothetical protein|nr:DUF4214 domain-containing protein [Pyrinomonadaceae bacterium]
MKPTTLRFSLQRLVLLTLIAFVAVAAFGIAASARRANRAKERAAQAANFKNGIDPQVQSGKQPNAPNAAVITATLTDNIPAATKVVPGGTINYTAVISNTGAASPADDATSLQYSGPLDANTTLVPGSAHVSPIAFNDTYNWIGNTVLDTTARALPAVTANDIAVNASGGSDTFTVTAIAGGATALGGTVTLASPSGSFTYTPPLNRPTAGDGASINDSFTYTITNSADPGLTSTGTVTITLTGRVFYLQAGAAGDGRSSTPSSNPATMSTNADKSSDIFYIFSNAASLSGLFTVDAGQQLLGQGVNLVVTIPTLGSVTLFNSAAPTPTTTNGAGNCVTLAGAPGNNTLSGFNIGSCSALAIAGSNVGTLAVNTMTINNTTGGGIDLTGVGGPSVNVVLASLTTAGGSTGASVAGVNGTVNLGSGALTGATGTAFGVNGGAPTVSYTGTITQNTAAQRVLNLVNTTGGSITLSGTITGGSASTGVNIGTVNGGITLTTVNLGTAGARMTNQALTITNGTGTYGLGTFSIFTNNTTGFNSTGADGTINCSSGSAVDSTNGRAMIIDGPAGLTTLGMTLTKVASTNSASTGLTLQDVNGSFSVIGDNANTSQGGNATGGTISGVTGADGSTGDDGTSNGIGIGIYVNNATGIQLRRMTVTNTSNFGLEVESSPTFTVQYCRFNGTQGDNTGQGEGAVRFLSMTGTTTVDNCEMTGSKANDVRFDNTSVNNTDFIVSNSSLHDNDNLVGNDGIAVDVEGTSVIKTHLTGNSLSNHLGDHIDVTTTDTASADVVITGNTCTGTRAAAPASPGDLGRGIRIFSSAFNSPALIRYNISNNNLTGTVQGGAIHVTAGGPGTGTYTGQITNNIIGATGVNGSGASQSDGIIVEQNGSGAHTVAITGNNIRQYFQVGINTNVTTPGTNGTMDVTITGNTVTEHATTASTQPGVLLNSGNTSGPPPSANAVCYDLKTNTLGGGGTNSGIGSEDFRVRQRFTTTVRLPGATAGDLASTAAIVTFIQNQNTGSETGSASTQAPGSFAGGAACAAPSVPTRPEPVGIDRAESSDGDQSTATMAQTKTELAPVQVASVPVVQLSSKDDIASVLAKTTPKASAAEVARIYHSERVLSHHAVRNNFVRMAQEPNAPTSGETITLNAPITLPAGKSLTIKYSATVNSPPLARSVSTLGTVTGNGPGAFNVTTTDPGPPIFVGATVTLVDTLMTWNGVTSTDWNTATNWTPPAGGTQYAPGVSNPAVNDVVIPNVGNQPTISATDIGVFSLSLANGRTLTITNPRVLTIGGAPGGDLTLDGIISGGFLNLGTGTHAINNAGGTGSLSATNVATVLSGSTVTLNQTLQAGAVAVNAGGSMIITNRTLSLNGSGAALAVPGGATFTTTGSTVVFNGTAAQTAAGIAYNNLTINNSIGTNVTGVTLTGNATVNGVLALTSSDLSTGAFVLSQPNTTASTGVSDVVGTITRTAAFGTTTITFGNPNNQITFGAAGTKPTALTVVLAKAAPASFTSAVQRNYTISQTGANTSTAVVRLHYLDSELNGNTPETSLGLRRLRTGDGHWVAAPPPPAIPTRDGSANWIEAPGVSGTDLPTQWTFSILTPTASDGAVTGRIVDDHGVPVEGAVVRLQGAQNRKFITDANGFYRFENVPTNGFYTVTPSRVNYSFSPATRSFSQLGESTEASFGATLATSGFVNPLDTPEYFVRQHYIDFLGREPDEAGFNFWSDQILECGGDQVCISRRRENVSAAYFLSIEFQKTGGLVDGLYRASYGAAPQYSSFMPDTRTIGMGVQVGREGWEALLQSNTETFVNSFVNRAAFHQVYDGMADSLFVDTLIAHTGVSFTAAERDALVGGLGTGQMTRAQALQSIAENSRFVQAKSNETFVMMEYMGYLRRDPDAGGFAFWLNKLNEFNGNFEQAEMVKAFIVSGEYRDRFPR